jgi:ComF family protein
MASPQIPTSIRRFGTSVADWARREGQMGAELIYPPRCTFCREEILGPADGILVCRTCRKQLTAGGRAACPRCATSLEGGPATATGACPRCRDVDWQFSAAFRLGRYRDELREAVLRMKHPADEPLAAAVGRMLATLRLAELSAWRPEVVVPVPMHWRRRLGRGANSPDLLAAILARRLKIRAGIGALARLRLTRPQNELPPEDRAENIRGAFRIKSSWDFRGARVLLVDDVMTTGATAHETAGVLRRGGASDVAVAVVARAEQGDLN